MPSAFCPLPTGTGNTLDACNPNTPKQGSNANKAATQTRHTESEGRGRTEKMADAHMMSQIEKYWRDSTEMPSTMPWFMVGV